LLGIGNEQGLARFGHVAGDSLADLYPEFFDFLAFGAGGYLEIERVGGGV